MNSTTTNLDAVQALRARGVDQAETLLEIADPDDLVALCRRFDVRQGRVGPGWIVSEARAGHFADPAPPPEPPTPEEQMRARFDETLRRLPLDTPIWRHADMEPPHRLEECPGVMRIEESFYPIVVIACSVCRDSIGVPIRHAHNLKALSRHDDPDDPF